MRIAAVCMKKKPLCTFSVDSYNQCTGDLEIRGGGDSRGLLIG